MANDPLVIKSNDSHLQDINLFLDHYIVSIGQGSQMVMLPKKAAIALSVAISVHYGVDSGWKQDDEGQWILV